MAASPLCVGIRTETKAREQRAPLSPAHVAALIRDHGLRVLVQRSPLRVFPDSAYAAAGAELVDEEPALRAAHVVLGVKEVPCSSLSHYAPGTTLVCFAHVIKAQPAGMALLDALLQRQLRLIDYEAITEGGVRGGRRLVAFGRFAGIAGAIDLLRGLGERCLALGHATPFLGVAATWQYASLGDALEAVRACGAAIARDGLHPALCPFVAVLTGAGRAAAGAREVWELLPLRWVRARELKALVARGCGEPADTRVVYACAVDIPDMVRRRRAAAVTAPRSPTAVRRGALHIELLDGGVAVATTAVQFRSTVDAEGSDGSGDEEDGMGDDDDEDEEDEGVAFDRSHYKSHPDEYEPTFHVRVAPYASVLVHCAYWGPGFPRLLTCTQARALSRRGRLRLLAIGDVSCDVGGALEMMQATSIANPFFVWDPLGNAAVANDITAVLGGAVGAGGSPVGRGVLYHAVDHLPTECPRDATEHFGAAMLPLLPALVRDAAGAAAGGAAAAAPAALPPELAGAVICEGGHLAPLFAYIAKLREAQERAAASCAAAEAAAGAEAPPLPPGSPVRQRSTSPVPHLARSQTFVTLELLGHLFDTGVLSRVLDAIEEAAGAARILECHVGRGRQHATELRLQVFAPGGDAGALLPVLARVHALAAAAGVAVRACGAESHLLRAALAPPAPVPPAPVPDHVLVLGSGFVSGPAIELLLRRTTPTRVTIASAVLAEATALARGRAAVAVALLDVEGDAAKLRELVASADVVISLVPAPLHALVARAAIDARLSLVTASYVAPELGALHAEAAAAGVTLLGECGLDPGIDHMTVCRLVRTVRARGGVVTDFASTCGGLPAPEAATNPLGYKWSWSPRGALAAMGNGAHYLRDGADVTVAPGALLRAASPTALSALPAFALELLPNRDSLPYAHKYGIAGPSLRSVLRGTLRYRGFSARMELLAAVGLLSAAPAPLPGGVVGATTLGALLGGLVGAPGACDSSELAAALLAHASAAGGGAPLQLSAADAAEFLEWLGGSATPVTLLPAPAPAPHGHFLPLDTLTALLTANKSMDYAPHERDMAAMQHELRVAFPDGSTEVHTSTLLEFATFSGHAPGTAMARTVGFTAAAAACVLLGARAPGAAPVPRGVCTPVTPELYEPILEMLKAEGINTVETVRRYPPPSAVALAGSSRREP